MKQLGMKQEELDVEEVKIKLKEGKVLLFKDPKVMKINLMGEDTFQLSGSYEVIEEPQQEEEKVEIKEEDIKLVMEKTGCSEQEAKEALEKSSGDLAEAILLLSSQ